jgi:hypothetical protein
MNDEYIDVGGFTLKNKPLKNFELLDAVKALKIKHFRGVFTRNQLPKRPHAIECGIINSDSSDGFETH